MKCYCINLDRREDRWSEFTAQVPSDCPLPLIERFPAIDGKLCSPPGWWTAGSGAWGCYRSHLRIIEGALNVGLDEIAIFEDDARFIDDFAFKFEQYVQALPDDWEWAFLGGQHLHCQRNPPELVNAHVLTPYNVNRTHAYMVRGRPMLEALYRHLQRKAWRPKHHIDHHYGQLIQERTHGIYTPIRWLVSQGAGKSNISGSEVQEMSWQPNRILDHKMPMVAVVGTFRGGTSCVAGVLHKLGICMGQRFKPPGPANPSGFFEAQQLAQLCRRCCKEPKMILQGDVHYRRRALSKWAYHRRLKKQRLHGGKHPSLCMMIPEVMDAWKNVKFIRVVRPAEESIASLKRLKWWPDGVAERVIPMMIATRDASLKDKDVHTIEYHELTKSPPREIGRLLSFLGHESHPAQVEDATSFVENR